MANDHVLEWFEPFILSVRDHEPELPVVVIPYDERTDSLERLADRHRFELWTGDSLDEFDALGATLTGSTARRRHNFRKLAVFSGPFDEFMFLDVDVIVLDRLQPMLDAYARSGLDLVYIDASVGSVYRSEEFRHRMVAAHGTVGWNSGAWFSRSGVTSLDEATGVMQSAAADLNDLRRWGEQTFLNYLSDVKAWSRGRLSDVDPSLPPSSWSRHVVAPDEPPQTIIHWAGDRPTPFMPHRRHYLRYRLRSLRTWRDRARFLLVTWPLAGARELVLRARNAVRSHRQAADV